MPEDKPGDFRYNTGPSAIPWAAVGEAVGGADLLNLVRCLVRPGDDEAAYAEKLGGVGAALAELLACGELATKLSLGERVAELEEECKRLLGCSYACFVTNATGGFEMAEQFANLGPGDEVIVPAITFIATGSYPLARGAKVVFADVDPRTINLDPEDVARKITSRTKMIIPVHIGGYPVDMDPIMALAEEHDLLVLEDAAHAFGGSYKGRMTGTIGHFGAYSFHEVKNINALGEGGLLVSNTDYGRQFAQARFLGVNMTRQIPDWLYDVDALAGKYGPAVAGNHSSTEIQAAVLLSQIGRLPEIIERRRQAAEYLSRRFAGAPGLITPPLDTDEIKSTHHLYLLQVDPAVLGADIQALKAKLEELGVTQIPHFAPLYHFRLFHEFGYNQAEIAATCPQAEEVFHHRFTHLPLYPLDEEQVALLADLVLRAVEEVRAR
ncbi:MAG TPA: DegT/DnrJ/EryC1/StrS family aminotransferase [Armatimonadota bacterium]